MVVSTEKLAWPKDRPLPGIERPLPTGTRVVSSDSHWLEPESFVDHMPAKFRDRAPVGKFQRGRVPLRDRRGQTKTPRRCRAQ